METRQTTAVKSDDSTSVTPGATAGPPFEPLQTIVSTARDSIYLIELDGTIVEINQAGARRFGHTRDELIGKSIFDLVPPDIAAQRKASRDRMIETCEPVVYLDQRNGQWFESNVQPILDDDGNVVRFSIFARDITERKRLEEQLAAAHKLQALGNVAGGVAHEVNNLLQAIVGYLELLTSSLDEQEEPHEFASTALDVAFGGQNLTQSLLSYVGKGRIDMNVVDLRQILAEFAGTLSDFLSERTEVQLSVDDDLFPVMADKVQLVAALRNLATNGHDAMPEGGTLAIRAENVSLDQADARVHANNVATGDYVRITVTDTGDGMSEEVKRHAFDPFFTTKEPGSGTGLGLSMVYGFVHRQSGGFVEVDSEQDRGSTFTIYLPRWQDEAEEIVGQAVASSPRQFKVLLVEDDESVLDSAKSNLERQGLFVLKARDGDQALTILDERSDIDILVSDIVMPGRTNGIKLAEIAQETHPDMKIILMTGYDEGEVAAHGSVPADCVILGKPFRMADLRDAINGLLIPSE